MILGIGCDLTEIDRIEKAGNGFCERYFTEAERELFLKKRNAPQTIAANFAVKEAFSKALGTGVRGFSLADVEVLRDSLGKPYINIYNGALKEAEKRGIKRISVSISHTGELAMGYVVVED